MADEISNDDKAKLRGAWRPADIRLDVFPLQSFATATVDSLSGLTYPFADIPVTSASADWTNARRGEYVVIRDGSGNWVMDTCWRKNSDSASFLRGLGIDRGDSGKAVQQAQALAQNHVATSYSVRVPKSFPSRLSGTTYYKRWDLAFSSFDPSPQANFGTNRHRAADCGTGTTATETFELDTSTSTSWGGGSFTVQWVKPSTASYAGGTTQTSNPVQITFVPGAYVLPCIVTDSSRAGSERSYSYVFVKGNDGGGNSYTPFSDEYGLVGVEVIHTREGTTMTFDVEGDASDDLYTGAPCLFTYSDEYSTDGGATWEALDGDHNVNNIFGYVYDYPEVYADENGITRTRFNVVSPLLYADKLPFFAQYLIETAGTPGEWWEIPDTHSHAAFVPFYVSDLHARWVAELHDYTYNASADLYFKVKWDLNADSMGGAMRIAASPFAGNFGCLPDGTFHLEMNPQYMETADRDAVATVLTITDADLFPPLRYAMNEVMEQRGIQVGAFIYTDTDNVKAKVYEKGGSGAPFQGIGRPTKPDFIALDATEAQYKVGHMFQELNAACKSVTFEMPGGYNIFKLPLMKWFDLDVASYDPMSSGIWSSRVLPETVRETWTYGNGGWNRAISVTAQPEVYGQPATRKVIQEYRGGGITPSTTWCVYFDFTQDNGNFTGNSANYIASTGWSYADQDFGDGIARRLVNIYKSFSSATITSISFTYALTKGAINNTGTACLIISSGVTQGTGALQSQTFAATSNTTNGTFSWTGQQTMTAITLFAAASRDETPPLAYSGDVVIMTAEICGVGANPFA